MKIVLGSDHGGFTLKECVKKYLTSKNTIEIIDIGCLIEESVDYPDIALNAASKLKEINADYIFAFCGTGIGISIALNKIDKIYCANIYNVSSAKLAKEHNAVNAIAMGGRELDFDTAILMVDAFLDAEVLSDNHKRRRAKIGY